MNTYWRVGKSILVHLASTNVNVEYDDIFKDEIHQKYMYSEHKQHVIVFRRLNSLSFCYVLVLFLCCFCLPVYSRLNTNITFYLSKML